MEPVSIFSPKKQRSADACLFPFGHFFQLIPIFSGFFCVFPTVYSSGFGICGNGCTSLMHSLPRSARFVKRVASDSLFFTIRSFPVCIYCPLSAWLRPANCNSGCRLTQRPGKLESCLSGFLSSATNWRLSFFAVIASQCAHWRGNPPVEWNQATITTRNRNNPRFFGCLSVHFPL